MLGSLILSAFVALTTVVNAAPANKPIDIGIELGSGSDDMPILKLPYGSYKAYSYDVTDDYYVFKNIRFAAPPVGDLRWKKPEPPLPQEGIQDGKTGFQCNQALNKLLSFGYPLLQSLEPASEDCLFLDVLVPGKAVRSEAKNLPVLVWIFGGGYVLGSKSFFLYDGHPLLKSGENNFIYVAGNYRLGGFGFLNGPTVEKEAVSNVAFYDQRAVFEWVQDYIGLLGGDKNTVTAMGESAGAGSIMHHLVMEGGTVDPLFHRAIMMSPAFEPKYHGPTLDSEYSLFEKTAGCEGKGIACLRTKSEDELQEANLAVTTNAQYGTFGFGPAVGQAIHDLPQIEMTNGNFWKNVSVIAGHTSNEGFIFANPTVVTNKQYDELMGANFHGDPAVLKQIEQYYPEPGLIREFQTQFGRLSQTIGDWVVNCNFQAILKAYEGSSWGYLFSVSPGVHAIDLLFAWWRTDLNIYDILQIDIDINFVTERNYATAFQSYLTSFVRSGSPNTYRQKMAIPPTIDFPKAEVGEKVKVLEVTTLAGFKVSQDDDSNEQRCGFWNSGVWMASD